MEFKLILKKLNNTLTTEEQIIFTKWLEESHTHRAYFNSVKKNYVTDLDNIDTEKGWLGIQHTLNKPHKKNNYWKYAVAASIVLLIALNFIFNKKEIINNTPIVVDNRVIIESGTDKATLTLEDGSVVELEKGNTYNNQNVSSNGEAIVYNANDENSKKIVYNYLTIPRGGQFQLKLSDGTEVWLNSETQLKFPVTFIDGETREVQLIYGEAYFDVSPSTNHKGSKFKVFNLNQEVEVLGTEFNIKAYKDEDIIYTTLVEGKVSVSNLEFKQSLVPNQQLMLDLKNKGITIQKIDAYGETSWRKGLFSFKSMTLKEIMVVLSRWYDVNVEFDNVAIESVKFNGVLSKNDSIEEILRTIKKTNFINAYEIKDKKIILK
ncbi:FecR family protein [Gelidibacter salicanalis]|uniref:DUF4974 domain-containing protein n=1 Tax=Gelidibacter salicanalis TaxID=291193 RepID=A0A934KQZ4_9FLAO|nr:FecR domain-containing protein [Gelidibacter salicanalis]MBJ7881904.1 DUF4974 domain-containing protein [Gelidibacter salicanalis]